MIQKTESEILFEELCKLHGVKCTPVSRDKAKTPDYDITIEGYKDINKARKTIRGTSQFKRDERWEKWKLIQKR